MITHFYSKDARYLTLPEFVDAIEQIEAVRDYLRPKTQEEIVKEIAKRMAEERAERLRSKA